MNTQLNSFAKALPTLSIISVVLMVIQSILGIMIAMDNQGMRALHTTVAGLFLLALLVTAISALMVGKVSGNKGTAFHAFGMLAVAVLQWGLAEMDQPIIHIILGVIILVGTIGLIPSSKKAIARATAAPAATTTPAA